MVGLQEDFAGGGGGDGGREGGKLQSDGGDLCTTVARFRGGDGGKEGEGLQK